MRDGRESAQHKDISRRQPDGGERARAKQTANSKAAMGAAKAIAKAKAIANRTAIATAAGADSRHLRRVADGFNVVLDRCLLDPSVETIHRVRTGSRRVQAMIETLLREAGAAGQALEKPAKSWLLQLKSIRRAVAPVRDLDVHRKLLEQAMVEGPSTPREPGHASVSVAGSRSEGVHGPDESAHKSGPEEDPRSSQARTLDARLKDKRHARAEALEKQIKRRRENQAECQTAFLAVVERTHRRHLKAPRSVAVVALETFVRAADALPSLDSSNLHEFRKRIKKARYVAESGGEARDSRILAKALKQMQDAIGGWHDWQCLADEAKTALGESGAELTVWLESKAERSLANALQTTEHIRGRLMGEWMATKGWGRRTPTNNPRSAPRKPPSRAAEVRLPRKLAAG